MTENYDLDPQKGSWTDLEAKIKNCRRSVLTALILTAVNIVFALLGSDTQWIYAMTAPYYFAVFGRIMDNGAGPRTEFGIYTRTGLTLAAAILTVAAALWYLSQKRPGCLKGLLVLMILDGAALLLVNLFLGGFLSGIFDLIVHGVLIWQLAVGIKASGQLEQKKLDYTKTPLE